MPDALPLGIRDITQQFLPLKRFSTEHMPLQGKNEHSLGGVPSELEANKLKQAAEDFEAVFVYQMLKQMRKTIHKEELFNGGIGEEMFTEMMDEELVKMIASRGETGIGKMMVQQLMRKFGVQDPESTSFPGLSAPAQLLEEKLQTVRNVIKTPEPMKTPEF